MCPFFLASKAAPVGSTPTVIAFFFLYKFKRLPSLQPISKIFLFFLVCSVYAQTTGKISGSIVRALFRVMKYIKNI